MCIERVYLSLEAPSATALLIASSNTSQDIPDDEEEEEEEVELLWMIAFKAA